VRPSDAPRSSILRVLAHTGARENEIVRLEGQEIDRRRRQVLLVKTKTNHPRSLAWQTPAGDVGPHLEGLPPHGWPFPVGEGKQAKPYANFSSNVGQIMRRIEEREKKAGCPFRRFRVHDLRHAFAIRWLQAGGNIYDLSRHLGHGSVKTTEGYLAFLTASERAGAQTGTQGHSQRAEEAGGDRPLSD